MNPVAASASTARILVVDDNPIIQRTMYFALRDSGYVALLCGEITDALKVIREQRLDLILLDLNFPLDAAAASGGARDGFWALNWVRHAEENKNTPVIVVSSDSPEKSKARALGCGAAAYFQKPVDKHELTRTIAALLAAKPTAPSAPAADTPEKTGI